MNSETKRREWWLEIEDECEDGHSSGHAHTGPCYGVDAVRVAEIKPGEIVISRDDLRKVLPCRCHEGYKIRGMIDPNCPIHDLEYELFGPEVNK